MTVEEKIHSAEIAAQNDGYSYVTPIVTLHYLEIALHHLKAQGSSLGNPDRKELVRAIKDVKAGRVRS